MESSLDWNHTEQILRDEIVTDCGRFGSGAPSVRFRSSEGDLRFKLPGVRVIDQNAAEAIWRVNNDTDLSYRVTRNGIYLAKIPSDSLRPVLVQKPFFSLRKLADGKGFALDSLLIPSAELEERFPASSPIAQCRYDIHGLITSVCPRFQMQVDDGRVIPVELPIFHIRMNDEFNISDMHGIHGLSAPLMAILDTTREPACLEVSEAKEVCIPDKIFFTADIPCELTIDSIRRIIASAFQGALRDFPNLAG